MAATAPEVKPARGPVSTQGVFRRTASGLIREMSMADHWMYNVFTLLVLTGAAQFYVWSSGEFPATNPILGLVVAAILVVPIYLAYSMLASAMPRSGGDYIFQSRILHPAVAFTALFALLVTEWYWLELSGFWIAAMTLSPLFSTLGVFVHSPGLLSLGTWFSSNWGIMVTTLVTNVLIALAFLPGLKTYLKVQWFLFAGVVISIVIMTFVMIDHFACDICGKL